MTTFKPGWYRVRDVQHVKESRIVDKHRAEVLFSTVETTLKVWIAGPDYQNKYLVGCEKGKDYRLFHPDNVLEAIP